MRIPVENRRLVAIGAAVLLLVVLALVLVFSGRGGRELVLYGNVDIRQVELGFRVGGRIAEMRFEEGDRVTAGAVLARLDDRPFQDELRQHAAAVDAEAANVEKLTRGTRPEEIEEARALVDERRATLANAERLMKRRQELIETGAVSQAAFDDARAAVSEARARLIAANKSLELALNGARIEDIAQATAQLNGAKARLA
ncbi:MAG TPA: biotin/lipoyl-binding protein, partial [Sphingomonadales bacterium]